MNELSIFITGLLFSCAVGALVGSILAISVKWRLTRRSAVIATISGLCALVIGAAFGLCYAVGGTGFIGYVCNLLIVPWVYIGIFTGWNIYSYILGAIIQTGLMTLAGWFTWRWIKIRKNRKMRTIACGRQGQPLV